jgi:hypothetical protein
MLLHCTRPLINIAGGIIMTMPTIGYLFPYIMCAKDLFGKLDDVLKSVLSAYGDSPNKHLVAFRLPKNAFENISPRPEWVVYVALGANDSLPKDRVRLIEYGWDVDVLPPSDALVYYKLLETDNPDKSTVAIGTVRSDDTVDWQYLEERMHADSYFWVRVVDNNVGEGGNVS